MWPYKPLNKKTKKKIPKMESVKTPYTKKKKSPRTMAYSGFGKGSQNTDPKTTITITVKNHFSLFFIFPPRRRLTSSGFEAEEAAPSPLPKEILVDCNYLVTLSASFAFDSLRRSGQRFGVFWINHGLHFLKSGPNSQYSTGNLQTPQQSTRTGWGFSTIGPQKLQLWAFLSSLPHGFFLFKKKLKKILFIKIDLYPIPVLTLRPVFVAFW